MKLFLPYWQRVAWANPALRLMNRLPYPKKVRLVALVVAFAILVLTLQLFVSLQRNLDTAQYEQTGLAQLQTLQTTLQTLLQQRQMGVLHRLDPHIQTVLPTITPAWLAQQSAWHKLTQPTENISLFDFEEQHRQLLADLLAHQEQVSNRTELAIDPDMATYYLVEMSTRHLPALVSVLSQLRTQGEILLYQPYRAGRVQTALDTSAILLPYQAQQLDDLLEKLFVQQPAWEATFNPTTRAADLALTDLLNTLNGQLRPQTLNISSAVFIAQANAVIERHLALQSLALQHIGSRLQARITELRWRLLLNLSLAGISLLVVSYMLWSMYAAFPIRRLIVATQRVAAGELATHLDIERDDEIGELARAFNHMTDALKQAHDDLEALVQARTLALAEKNHLLMESINYASVIQQALLHPSQHALQQFCAHFVWWEPRDVVGGDFFYVRHLPEGTFLALLDCTGHGVPGAFMTLLAASSLDALLAHHCPQDPAAVLATLNRSIKQLLDQHLPNDDPHVSDDGMDALCCWLDPHVGILRYAGAQLPLWFSDGSSEELQQLNPDRMGVGYRATPINFQWNNHELPLQPQLRCYASTDGLLDQIGQQKRVAFGKRRARETLAAAQVLSFSDQLLCLKTRFHTHQGHEKRRDDVCVIGFSPHLIKDVM